ncbi:hypothetical protein EBZ80_20395, partial [bacterium]|nr:hypothetical protein [bacterium]
MWELQGPYIAGDTPAGELPGEAGPTMLSVSISHDTLAVGFADLQDAKPEEWAGGTIKIYTYVAGSWDLAQTITGTLQRPIGNQVVFSLDGQTLVTVVDSLVTVYQRTAGSWTRHSEVRVADPDPEGTLFLASVAIAPDELMLSVYIADVGLEMYARVYAWETNQWVIRGSDFPSIEYEDHTIFYRALGFARLGDELYVLLTNSTQESTYLYTWDSADWSLQFTFNASFMPRLTATQLVYVVNDGFGAAVMKSYNINTGGVSVTFTENAADLTLGTMILGFSGENSDENSDEWVGQLHLSADGNTVAATLPGRIDVYRLTGGVWESFRSITYPLSYARPSDGTPEESFGILISLSNNWVSVSADGARIGIVSVLRDRLGVYTYSSVPCFHGTTPLALAGGGTVRASAVRPGMLLMDSRGQGQRVI